MRTSSAQCRRTGGQILDIGQSRRIHALYYLLYQVCAQLARFAKYLISNTFNAQAFYLTLNVWFQFLHHIQLFNRSGKFADLLLRQRIHHAQLQNAGMRQGLLHILVAYARTDHAYLSIARLDTVQFGRIAELFGRFDAL